MLIKGTTFNLQPEHLKLLSINFLVPQGRWTNRSSRQPC